MDVDIAGGSVQPRNATLRAAAGQRSAVKPIDDRVFDFTVDDPGTVTIVTRDPAQTVATIQVGAQQPR